MLLSAVIDALEKLEDKEKLKIKLNEEIKNRVCAINNPNDNKSKESKEKTMRLLEKHLRI
ncbi:hypothetical protein [Alteromonas sp. a30]|uniref:hypothetical protein n=1 Tax=Alteromonas sp. a30 TaxID=2730917 RepID=UPI00228225E2|nr:hypothetical protein [Alteromonas sp. a30]MCY7296231.1 hypothetical protein [Alteromonas sp. a30]